MVVRIQKLPSGSRTTHCRVTRSTKTAPGNFFGNIGFCLSSRLTSSITPLFGHPRRGPRTTVPRVRRWPHESCLIDETGAKGRPRMRRSFLRRRHKVERGGHAMGLWSYDQAARDGELDFGPMSSPVDVVI